MRNNKAHLDKPLAMLTLAIVFVSVAGLSIYSKESIAFAAQIMGWTTRVFTAPVLIFTFLSVIFCFTLAFSKFGKIKLGRDKPEYSTMTWIFMFFLSGMGSDGTLGMRAIKERGGLVLVQEPATAKFDN